MIYHSIEEVNNTKSNYSDVDTCERNIVPSRHTSGKEYRKLQPTRVWDSQGPERTIGIIQVLKKLPIPCRS